MNQVQYEAAAEMYVLNYGKRWSKLNEEVYRLEFEIARWDLHDSIIAIRKTEMKFLLREMETIERDAYSTTVSWWAS